VLGFSFPNKTVREKNRHMKETGYKDYLWKDLTAGLVVFLVALPLCLGIALASNAPLISGLVAGIVGGLLVSWLSGSHTSVSGPAAGLTAIVFAQITKLGSYETFLCAVVLAGVFQVFLGWIKAGSLAAFFPSSVIKGLLAAIGIILILKQIPHLFGHDPDWMGDMSFIQDDGKNTFSEILATTFDIHPGATAVGLLSLILLVVWDKTPLKKIPVPAPLAVVVFGTLLSKLISPMGGLMSIGASHLVQVPVSDSLGAVMDSLAFPNYKALLSANVLVAALTIAVVATLETLLNLEAVDKLDSKQRVSPPNRELMAQGAGNMVSGLLGGLPITSVIIRSSVNIASGGQTRLSCFFHGVFLCLTVLFVPSVLNQIPLSCLAAILMVTGFKLANPQLFRRMWKEGVLQFTPFLITIIAIVLTDLLIGIVVGMVISICFILNSNLKRPLRKIHEKHVGGEVLRIQLSNQVSFLNRASLLRTLNEIPNGSQVVIDARDSDYVDPDILDLLSDFEQQTAPAHDLKLSLIGFKDRYKLEDKEHHIDVSTRDIQEKATPQQILNLLREGNKRFARGEKLSRDLIKQRDATSQGQFPLATVLACMDSRVPTELVFDLGIGDLFSVRVAGNIAFNKSIGSLEFGCAVAGAKVLVVLGHTKCGAVKATIDLVDQGKTALQATGCENLDSVTEVITCSVNAETETSKDRCSQNEAFVDRVARLNVLQTMEQITQNSPTLKKLVDQGEILLVGGIYDVSTGLVEFLGEHAHGES
jgi:MFS superfamily sulfate permease-like transporter